MKSERIKKIGFLLCAIGVVLMVTLGLFFYFSLKPSFLNRSIRKSVLGMDKEMQLQIQKGLNHDELEKSQTGLTIFMNDTLVYWNRNDVNPKLVKRKVVVGNDTICPLLSGNYYVKSYESGNMTYYVYKLVNTTYQIDNPYFENVTPCLPKFINADIRILDNADGIPLVNGEGKILSIYQIDGSSKLKVPFRYLWPLPLLLLVIVGLILAYGKQRESRSRDEKKSHSVEIGIVVILLVSLIGTYVYYRIGVRNENEQMRQQAQI